MRSRPRILLLEIEFPTWKVARSWSYAAGLGMEEGLAAAEIDYLTVTTPWFPRIREICAGQRFDQVWLDIARHQVMEDSWLEYVASLAPVRVAFLGESLEYTPDEWLIDSELRLRKQKTWNRLRYVTHVAAVDEHDAESIAVFGKRPAIMWPQAVPARFITDELPAPCDGPAVFSGAPYGSRAEWLARPDLQRWLRPMVSPENATLLPELFDAIHSAVDEFLASEKLASPMRIFEYLHHLRLIRHDSFRLWLEGMRTGCAVVNLPHVVKGYAGRVVEAMAAGRPMISWRIPDRPRNLALFVDGDEILLYSPDSPDELAEHIARVANDPVLAQRLATSALRKVRERHTVEHRVRQILDWVENGDEPAYA